jgi:hypothetical protein
MHHLYLPDDRLQPRTNTQIDRPTSMKPPKASQIRANQTDQTAVRSKNAAAYLNKLSKIARIVRFSAAC